MSTRSFVRNAIERARVDEGSRRAHVDEPMSTSPCRRAMSTSPCRRAHVDELMSTSSCRRALASPVSRDSRPIVETDCGRRRAMSAISIASPISGSSLIMTMTSTARMFVFALQYVEASRSVHPRASRFAKLCGGLATALRCTDHVRGREARRSIVTSRMFVIAAPPRTRVERTFRASADVADVDESNRRRGCCDARRFAAPRRGRSRCTSVPLAPT